MNMQKSLAFSVINKHRYTEHSEQQLVHLRDLKVTITNLTENKNVRNEGKRDERNSLGIGLTRK